jgi:Phospholipase_D-nuclease N-terminal
VQLLSFLLIGIWVYCLIDILTSRRTDVRNLPKWAWFVVVLVLPPVGVVLWFVFGRPHRGGGVWTNSDVTRGTRPHLPRRTRPQRETFDDEATIRARIAERDALLARWAEEDERRRRGEGPPPRVS